MRPLLGVLALTAASMSVLRQSTQVSATLAISNVAVVDVARGVLLSNQTVLISGNRIVAIGPASKTLATRSAQSLNATGKFLIPGLWDMHSHVTAFGRTSLALYLTQGVTGIRDMGAERFAVAKAWRDSIAAGQLLGPRMRIASPIVENQRWLAAVKRMGEAAGTPWRLYERYGPASADEAVRWVDSVVALGADHIKVRNWPSPEISRAIVDRARERGLQVVGHGNEPFPRTGVATLEHGIWPPVQSAAARDSLWRQLVANGVAMVPTLVTWPIRLDPPDTIIAELNAGRISGLRYVPSETRQEWRDQMLELKQENPMDWKTIYHDEMRNAAEMHRAGMTLLAGTDIGSPLLVPGFSLHDELDLLVSQAGMTPVQALQAATILPARVMGLADSLSSVAVGKVADPVVLDANPLAAIGNTRRIHAVIANGRLLARDSLDRMLAAAEAAASTQTQQYPLESSAGLRLYNVVAEPDTLQGKRGLRLTLAPGVRTGPAFARIDALEFGNGTIEVEVAGAPAPGAPEGARGFVGIAFRVLDDQKTYDAFYLRPTNGRADDQERRNHATQYISHPEWTWSRLREETPSKYEAYVDLVTGAWTKIRIEVRGGRARLYVRDHEQPTLIVNDAMSGDHGKGAVALWLDTGTIAHFRNLVVTTN